MPYYAGSRVVTYRTDLFKHSGVTKAPTSLAMFQTDLGKVGNKYKSQHGFKPFYMAGTDWYSALSFLYDYGGSIAALSKGKWVGQLESAKSIAGLTAYKKFFLEYSPHSAATLDEANPAPYTVFSQNDTSAIFGPGWFSCCTGATYKNVTAQFVMPSHVAGKSMPGFLGGSDLAVPAQGHQQAQAREWIADFTSTTNEKALQAKGNIPNATNLLDNSRQRQGREVELVRADGEALGRRREREYPPQLLSKILTGTPVKHGRAPSGRESQVHPQPALTH